FGEWIALPQLWLSALAALGHARTLAEGVAPDPAAMAAGLKLAQDGAYAEALSFALARQMPRPEAQAEAKRLAQRAAAEGRTLAEVARAAHPGLDPATFDARSQLGQAPSEARAFAARVRARR
ncbi:MAG: adenylosuccinate lyase family protein, partial [Rhodosalinus sp.]